MKGGASHTHTSLSASPTTELVPQSGNKCQTTLSLTAAVAKLYVYADKPVCVVYGVSQSQSVITLHRFSIEGRVEVWLRVQSSAQKVF